MSRFRIPWKTLISLLLVAGLCLLPALSSLADEPLSFKDGQAAFERGEFKSALRIFQQLVGKNPGDPELDFMLGRSAFQSGDYETAVFAFERVLMARPEADRVRLEMGRSFFELGELESARDSFQTVLDHNPPVNVSANIERYLLRIDKASLPYRFSGLLSLALSYDNNVHYSPIEEQIQGVDGIITLDKETATPQEDLISQNTLALNHLYRQHPQLPGWMTGLVLYNAIYFEEQNLNLSMLGINTGPIWQQGAWQGKLQGSYNYLTLDDAHYLTTAGIELEETWQRDAGFGVGLLGSMTILDYEIVERQAQQYRMLIKPTWAWQNSRLSSNFGVELSDARDNQHSYQRFLLKISWERKIPWQMILSLGGRWQDSAYKDEAPLFGKKRHDVLGEASLGLSRVVWSKPIDNRQLRALLNFVVSDASSNIDLYQYDKQVLSFSLSYLF